MWFSLVSRSQLSSSRELISSGDRSPCPFSLRLSPRGLTAQINPQRMESRFSLRQILASPSEARSEVYVAAGRTHTALDLRLTISVRQSRAVNNDTIGFNATVQGWLLPDSYNWSFGDSKYSSAAAPSHIHARPGTFNVTLRVSDLARTPASANLTVTISDSMGSPAQGMGLLGPPFITSRGNWRMQAAAPFQMTQALPD